MGGAASDEVKKQDRSSSLEGTKKPTDVKGEYTHFTITPFHPCILCTTPFHCVAISPCEHGCVFSSPFHHISFTIALYQPISPYCHFTMLTWVCILCTISPYSFHHISVTIHFTISQFYHYSTISQQRDAEIVIRSASHCN